MGWEPGTWGSVNVNAAPSCARLDAETMLADCHFEIVMGKKGVFLNAGWASPIVVVHLQDTKSKRPQAPI